MKAFEMKWMLLTGSFSHEIAGKSRRNKQTLKGRKSQKGKHNENRTEGKVTQISVRFHQFSNTI